MPKLPSTERGIAAIKTPTRRLEYVDSELPGFALRVTPNGVKAWVVRYKLAGGARQRLTLGTTPPLTLQRARKRAEDALSNAQLGTDPAALKHAEASARKDVVSIADVVALYIKDRRPNLSPDALAEYRRMLKAYVERAPAFRIPPATASDKEYFGFRTGYKDWLEDLAEKHGPVQSNRVYQLVRAAARWARVERLIRDNPIDGVKRPRPETPRVRILSENEIRWLLEVLDEGPPLEGEWVSAEERARRAITWQSKAAIVWAWLLCGTRETETLLARWPDVDVVGRLWTIPGEVRKGGRPHLVPLAPQLARRLEQLQELTGDRDRVFAGAPAARGQTRHRWWSKIVEGARAKGAAHFTVHDLRKTCATGLGDLGTHEDVVSLILGHKKKSVTGRHYNFSDRLAERRAALTAWAARVDAIVAGGRSNVLPMAR
jgi:integrase